MLDQDTPKYKCDEILRRGVVDSDKPSASLQQLLRQDLEENYTGVFSSLIACEEYQMWIDIRRYDMSGVRLTRRDGIFLALQVMECLKFFRLTYRLRVFAGSRIG